MKEHTSNFETEIKTYGRQQAVQVIYEQDGEEVVLDNENVFSATPNFKASLLKSAMKSLILDCSVEIPVGTRLQFKYGILVGNDYEYLNFGYYIVNKVEKKEDARSYEMTCYDKMMLSMVDYIDLGIEYPITIRNYIAAICNHLEIDFGSNQDQFVNYDKEIEGELYLDENGDSLDYTFRDVLDELSQATASVICIDENDQLVVRYPQRNGDYETIEGTALYIENADDGKIDLELQGNTTQNGTPTPDAPIEVNNVTGLQKVRVCGKNLINYEDFTGTITNYYFKGLPSTNFGLEAGKTYTLSFDIVSSVTPFAISVGAGTTGYAVDIKQTGNHQNGRNSITFTPTESKLANGNILHFRAPRYGTSQSSVSFTISNVQLEETSSATSFEKYQSKDYEINLGKNLFNINDRRSVSDDVTINNEGWITITYDNTSGSSTKIFNCKMKPSTLLKPNTMYRMFVEIANTEGTGRLTINEGNSNSSQFQSGAVYSFTDFSNNNIYYKDLTTWSSINNRSVFFNQYMFFNAGQSGSITYRVSLIADTTLTTNSFTYSPYFTPIELNKIGDYQDFIRKGTGKNICNNADIEAGFPSGGIGSQIGITSSANSITYKKCCYVEKSKTYTLSWKRNTPKAEGSRDIKIVDENDIILESIAYSNASSIRAKTFTPNNSGYIYVAIDTNATEVQIEENSSATYYEPYGYKDKWYIEKNVEKVVLDGTQNITLNTSNPRRFNATYPTLGISNVKDGNSNADTTNYRKCDHFAYNTGTTTFGNYYMYNNWLVLYDVNSEIADANALKTWFSNNNTKIYYVLANPTYTLIDNEELIEQLDRIHLEQGLNNVMISSSNLPSSLKMNYVSNLVGIDEDYLKNINVNFGEKYGPINSLVIARAADSDFIYKEDEQSVAEDGLCEIKISDNQILNNDSRVQFIDGMFNQLRGTEFYLNDFSSTGIAFLDLLDYYKIKVFDNTYKCLMLNDELDITQGLQEQIFTDRPEESETEYKSLSKQDKDIRRIGIIVNKVDGEITAEIIARQNTDENVSRLQQSINEISSVVSTTTEQVTDIETIVNEQSTTISQTVEGLSVAVADITRVQNGLETLETNTEDVVNQLVFGADGLTISNKGSSSEDMKLNLTNDAIKFLYQNNAVLTINGSVIEFSNASFKKLDLGNYVWQAEDDDSLSLIYES